MTADADAVEYTRQHWAESGQPAADHFAALAALMRTHQLMVNELDRLLKPHSLSRTAFLLMAESAFLRLAFVSLGLNPDSGGTHMLPGLVGRQRANEIAMLGESVTSAKAVEWGIAHRAVPDGELEAAAGELAARLAAGPSRAYAAIKRAFNAGERPGLAEQLELEGELVHSLAQTEDFAEGVNAFLERRPARFEGR